MTPSPVAYQLFVGVDIAATTFAASWTSGSLPRDRAATYAQTPDGFTAFQDCLRSLGVPEAETLVVIEAIGSYWVALAVSLHEAGYTVAVVNPAQVHNYALSLPRRAKTDALDAQLLAQFAAERQPPRWTPPPQVYHELRQRLVARDGLLSMRQQARNQRHALLQWPIVIDSVRVHLDKVIAELDERLSALEAGIAQVLSDGAWAESARLLTSIKGIGLLTTAWLLVGTLNFQACTSAESAAAYIGLVPLARESGSSV
jgi:transposase